jgi:quinol monooxygenase YgiN
MVPSAADYGHGMHSYEVAWEDKDPDRIIMIVRFKDRESYMANADRPETDTDYQKQLEYLDGEPEWIDVNYAEYVGQPLGPAASARA